MRETIKGYEISINVDTVMKKLEEELKSSDLFMPSNCCIFKVPTILLRHNHKAYYPNAFSIGPFHYNKQPLMKATQKIKLKYLAVSDSKELARESYAGPIEIDNEEFIKVLVLDGCFIVELFRKHADETLRDRDDPIFTMSCLLQFLYHDLILLENQVPWFVLEILFDMTKIDTEQTLDELAILFFTNIFSATPLSTEALPGNHGSKHILDLLRNCLLLSSRIDQGNMAWQPMPSATSLKDAGIKFKKCSMAKSILDITFEKGVLEMSPLFIQETTEPLFRNLISFDQCCPKVESVITSYAILMDNLINTNKDMEILCKNKVIENWLNVEDATRFFNQLYDDTYIKENFYACLTKDVNDHCERRWPWGAVWTK
ncbi:hypothetical protein UlMin_013772 [Ulmus minor]